MTSLDLSRVISRILDAVSSESEDGDLAALLEELEIDDRTRSSTLDRTRSTREELSRLRRREHELGALFASARDLAEVRDIDGLLERLVSRAHDMMGSDVTYLSEFDSETEDLHVRKTTGSVTPQFRNLRVPAGTGLASRIAESRSAQWVRRYSEYNEGTHDTDIDDAVSLEGIVSILGVPMLSDGQVLGVLFSATRQEHVFAPEQIALLSALADHASIVLQSANTLARLRASEEDAQSALRRLTDHVAVRDRSNTVHQELVQAVLVGGGFIEVTTTLARALGRCVTVVDSDMRVLASSEALVQVPATVSASSGVRLAIERSRATGHCSYVEPGTSDIEVVAAVTAGELFFGAVLLSTGDLELGAVDDRTIERAAQVAALLTLQQNAVDDSDRRARHELIADALDPSAGRRRDFDRRARAHNVDASTLDTVLLFVVPLQSRSIATSLIASRFHDGGLVSTYSDAIVALVHSSTPAESAEEVRQALLAGGVRPALVIVPTRADSVELLSARFEVAHRTARLLEALGIDDRVVTTESFLPYVAMFGSDPENVHTFIDHVIGPVISYDEAHGTDLLATLRAFVRSDSSPTKAARALNYHTNTILQRLDRVRLILGDHWREDESLFRISTAVRLEALRSPSTPRT
ncbi:GAF domain-containing protein [Rhodococcus sp. 15-649-2-2]|uniref:helix-turn-helix domain-containing protein n=1 Tax=Rhodococcus sp. 15-649-2-2 TaxID=2023140 RepID=UPI000B9A4B99|nr:GAF domain-containing protein [Rhodococcus sp. 15-649-2-2]OZE78277.1 GAF domain-containing protein [Rhodococcus sp. 15-649-2-2]